MNTSHKLAGAVSVGPTLMRFHIALAALLGGLLLVLVLLMLTTLTENEAFADVTHSSPGNAWAQVILSVDPPCGTLDGITIDHMEVAGDWQKGMGNGAISANLTTVPGYNGQAIRLDYNLGTSPGAYVQLVRTFSPALDLSAGDHLRFFHQGTTTNTLEVGITSEAGENYFGSGWNEATHVRWWTYATWDFQDFLKGDIEPFPDFSKVKAIFISVTKKNRGVGGTGSFIVDEVQYLKVATRTMPAGFESVTTPPTVTQQAAEWIAAQMQPNGLLQSWLEEAQQATPTYSSWLYDLALGLIVLSETDVDRATLVFNRMHNLQNNDGSWYAGYNYSTTLPLTTTKPVGANSWMVYALTRFFLKSGNQTAYQDAMEGATWLAGVQRSDGSLPGEIKEPAALPDNGAPTEANLDAWWAFQATGHQTQADKLKNHLLNLQNGVWDYLMGRFKSSGNMYPARDRYHIYLDNQTWGAAFLRAVGRNEDARRALSYARWTLAATSSNGSLCGFDGAGPFSVWNEGTLQYIAAHGENSQYYWGQMVSQRASDGGLPGSPDSFDGRVWLTPWHGVAPTSWLYFAGTGGPFHITSRIFLPLIMR